MKRLFSAVCLLFIFIFPGFCDETGMNFIDPDLLNNILKNINDQVGLNQPTVTPPAGIKTLDGNMLNFGKQSLPFINLFSGETGKNILKLMEQISASPEVQNLLRSEAFQKLINLNALQEMSKSGNLNDMLKEENLAKLIDPGKMQDLIKSEQFKNLLSSPIFLQLFSQLQGLNLNAPVNINNLLQNDALAPYVDELNKQGINTEFLNNMLKNYQHIEDLFKADEDEE